MFRSAAALLFAVVLTAAPAFAAEKPVAAAPFTAAQKAAINEAVKDYIMSNPQVMISSVEAYYNKQNATKQAQEGPLKDLPAGLLDYPNTPSEGPKDAKVTVVEFFDYNCGYCKQVVNDVQELMNEDKSVRVVFKDLPILSDTSEVAARYALAANKQGKYLPYHLALLQHQGPITEAFLTDTAKTVGLNVDQLKKDANTQEVRDVLAKNVSLARDLGVRGTPFFVIGRQKVPGAIGISRMKEIIAQEGGASATTSPSAGAPAAVVPDVKTDAIKSDAGAAVTGSSDSAASSGDASGDAEIAKARAEANAMVAQIKEEAEKMQTQAAAAQKEAEKAMADAKAKEDAANAAAKK